MKLVDVFNEESIRLDELADTWQDAVRLVGSLLIEQESIEERYITAMIDAVKTLGPYMVIAPGIAIAHARPEDGAKKIGISLVRLKPPVEFGSKNNDPVDLVFGLSALDHDSHIDVLRDLAGILQNKEIIEVVRLSNSIEEIFKAISNN